jgi:hypothetical protein
MVRRKEGRRQGEEEEVMGDVQGKKGAARNVVDPNQS